MLVCVCVCACLTLLKLDLLPLLHPKSTAAPNAEQPEATSQWPCSSGRSIFYPNQLNYRTDTHTHSRTHSKGGVQSTLTCGQANRREVTSLKRLYTNSWFWQIQPHIFRCVIFSAVDTYFPYFTVISHVFSVLNKIINRKILLDRSQRQNKWAGSI